MLIVRVEVQRITRISDQHRLPIQSSRPENLTLHELIDLRLRHMPERELSASQAIAAARHRNRLPLARLQQLQLLIIERLPRRVDGDPERQLVFARRQDRSEEHTSELQ